MIKKLRSRERIDLLKINERSGSPNWGKWIYFSLLLAFSAALANYVVGSAVFLRAEGIVLRTVTVVAAPYDAHVQEINVRPGQRVEKGEDLASLRSAAMTRSLSELASQQAAIRTRLSQLESRIAIVKEVLPLASARANSATDYMKRLLRLEERGNANIARLKSTSDDYYKALETKVSLEMEVVGSGREVREHKDVLAKADAAFEQLRSIYGGGKVTSPASGTVGSSVVSVGEVVLTGRKLLEVYSGGHYVLAFLPAEYLFSVQKGDKVLVSSGTHSVIATIDEMLPVADSLPAEFRSAFRARERSQLVRISLDNTPHFAVQ